MKLVDQYWAIVTGVIALAAAIAAVTPSKTDNKIIQIIFFQ